jgi:hypothetical protein
MVTGSLGVEVEGSPVLVTPGQPATVRVRVTNRLRSPVRGRIAVHGGLVLAPTDVIVTLAPGQERLVEVRAELAPGTPPGLHRASVLVAAGGEPPRSTDIELAVAGAEQLEARLTSAEPSGGSVARTAVELVNRSAAPLDVLLEARCAGGRMDLAASRVIVGPSSTAIVRATIRAAGPLYGTRRRLPFVVDVDGAGSTCLVGTFVQKPLLSGGVVKLMLVVGLLTAWAIGLLVLLAALR